MTELQKNIFMIFQKKFGDIEKLITSLHRKTKNMHRNTSNIKTANRFSLRGDLAKAGQVFLHE